MADSTPIYVVMRASGEVMTMRDGLSGNRSHTGGGYLVILGMIADELQSAGGNYDLPDKLFLNGTCVVEKGLHDLAWAYRRDELAVRYAAAHAVRKRHWQEWVPADEKKMMYESDGWRDWTVERKRAT